jgi:hypothetical protein
MTTPRLAGVVPLNLFAATGAHSRVSIKLVSAEWAVFENFVAAFWTTCFSVFKQQFIKRSSPITSQAVASIFSVFIHCRRHPLLEKLVHICRPQKS